MLPWVGFYQEYMDKLEFMGYLKTKQKTNKIRGVDLGRAKGEGLR